MAKLESLLAQLPGLLLPLLPLLAVVAIAGLLLFYLSKKGREPSEGARYRSQWMTLLVVLVALCGAIIVLPVSDSLQGNLLTMLGLLLTAIITLSSTTIAANAMAGLMIRSLENFKPGDFIQVNNYFGRVTEQDLFHIEIQTEDRDLLTLPNVYVAANPVKVVHASGTVVTAEVTLGYELDHHAIEKLLKEAAVDAGLEEPFVYVMDLGDFSVCYRVAGFLQNVRQLLSARSKLRKHMLDSLHGAGVEIVSPNFMNQRQVGEQSFIPQPRYRAKVSEEPEPEAIVFDKAERAQSLQELKDDYEELKQELAKLEADTGKDDQNEQLEKMRRRKKAIRLMIQRLEDRKES
ncbi:mechanosensitive ion channel family protein [Pseudoteredinibacter isoporae]|uniref:Small-conductance mechanosensitive channel n=1 Tax=Pseudoteredinibacter isoporae TaxID=570281 RepID=A0A7X0MU58_9GAMM|nr:mechanosensitive ion channel family protein [Pseudoteredinibacter isoporae]MBB6519918.1 small-conductance mechanosensitive channel [Pseudoteredinibacter isoporae]NHO85494.1 mechanosensitive ion channel [Pseudoteredinibacter isoporae]NIB26054.1 mechanosensitive ion channel [Pseudoteredinibacter isoporae]